MDIIKERSSPESWSDTQREGALEWEVTGSLMCRECISLVKELGFPVEHIVLPTFAVEHKLFVGPFARKFPSAKVHVAPR